jgi:hypothetical protein
VPGHDVTDSFDPREFINFVNSNFNKPSRRKLTRDISPLGKEDRGAMNNLLMKICPVTISADSWSAHNRSFRGKAV